MDPKETQDAQIILGNSLRRVADKAHASCRNIFEAAYVIVNVAGDVNGQTVDGEVAPPCITHPVAAKRDLRSSPERLGILAQRRDLEGVRIDDQRDSAMVDSGRHAFDPGGLGAAGNF